MWWFLFFAAVAIALAYHRVPLRATTAALGGALLVYGLFGHSPGLFVLWLLIFGAIFVPLNMPALRRKWLARPALEFFRRVLPEVSETERAALESGSVWWEGELFSGCPDWHRFASLPRPQLSAEEQAFLDGPVEEFCRMLDEWRITHIEQDIPAEAWAFAGRHKFFGMIVPKQYGGLGFSAAAHSAVLVKIASSGGGTTAASIVSVPNSLGPAELLLHYGTDEQKDHYLPRLADGREIPCFALTSPWAGSDAAAMPDQGVVCRGNWKGKEVLGMRLTFDKRYITLAPVATVVGLAFKLYDPEKLLGGGEELGITCALIPRDAPGLEIGKRHLPLNNPFMNGPVRGRDVFVPLDFIIGGPQKAGQGWRMLMECLAVGRSISLPSNTTGTALAAAAASGAYARLRRQFGLPVGQFETVQEALARIGAYAYAADAVRQFTALAVDQGEKPSVASAIAKLHCTEMSREIARLAMDIHAGKGVMLGPRNWIARNFQGTPISITVEGANLLTRGMIVFGQGALRCHPFVQRELAAVREPNAAVALERFDDALFAHIGHVLSAAARSLVLGLTFGRVAVSAPRSPARPHYQAIARYSANFALMSDAAMALYGGSLKFRESVSARLGDVLSYLYIASSALKRFEDEGRAAEDLAFVQWICTDGFAAIEARMDAVLRHLPSRSVALLLRLLIFPLGRRARPPHDETGTRIAEALQEPGPARERLFAGVFAPDDPAFPQGLLNRALAQAIECEALERRVHKAARDGVLKEPHPVQRIEEAARVGVLTQAEAKQLAVLYELLQEILRVDEFDAADLVPGAHTERYPG